MTRASLPLPGGWAGILAVAAVVALGVGAVVASADDDGAATSDVPSPAASPSPSESTPPAAPPEYLVWGHGGLPDRLLDALASTDPVAVSVVAGDRVDIRRVVSRDGSVVVDHEPGWVIPLDAQAVDPADHAAFVSAPTRAALEQLRDGEVLLSDTEAEIRGVGAGAVLTTTDDVELTVADVVADEDIGWAEIAFSRSEPHGVDEVRYVLLRYAEPKPDLEAVLEGLAGEDLRVKLTADAPYRRHGDETLPPVVLKERFGEFALKQKPGRFFQAGGSWMDPNIVTESVPILGRITCHREAMPAVRAALQSLRDQGLEHLVVPRAYGGCWAPRVIGSSRTLSHHAWGVSIDLNVLGGDPFNTVLDPRLVEAFEAQGFLWGGRFLRPDPAHFDYVGPSPTG